MRLCKFPTAPTMLGRINENLDFKVKDNELTFMFNNILYKGASEDDLIRIVLTHKITGEKIYFDNSKPTVFRPDIEKLIPKETKSNLGTSFAELTRELGSAKAQKVLREKEKLNINKEAQKILKDAQKSALKEEKIEASKGNKLDRSFMDTSIDGSFSYATITNLIDSENRIKLSTIAPEEVLEDLKSESQSLLNMTYEDVEKLEGKLSFHRCILEVIKKSGTNDLRKLQFCVLLEYMIRFHGLPIKQIRSRTPLHGCPNITTMFLLSNFSKEVLVDGGKSTIIVTKEEKDKLLLIITALFGYLNDYEFPIHNFMIDIKVGREKLKKIGQIVNIKIKFVNREHYAKAENPYVLETL